MSLLISYYETYLTSSSYSLLAHMTEPFEISTLLFMMLNSKNQQLHKMIGSHLSEISWCHTNKHIYSYTTNNPKESMTGCHTTIIYSYFPPTYSHGKNRTCRTNKMDFTNLNIFDANQLDHGYDIPNSFNNNNTTNLNEASIGSFNELFNKNNNHDQCEFDKILDLLYKSIYPNRISNTSSSSSSFAFSEKDFERTVSTASTTTDGSICDSDATIDLNAIPIAPYQ